MAIVETAFADETLAELEPLAGPEIAAPEIAGEEPAPTGPFEISEVVARIDAFWRHREETGEPLPQRPMVPAEHFRFETDAKGVIRWVEGVSRAPIVGLSLDLQGLPDGSRVDGVAAGAFRRRAGFSNARMAIEGESEAAGAWLISAIPVFDPANGRFTGYRGTARRPRADERAEPARPASANPAADSLRQLVHELRTPTNAIAGFAEMIETQMLGPVSDPYRDRASVIRGQARELLGAIDDLDLAARIDSAALALVPAPIKLRPVLAGIADDLAQLAALRGSGIALPIDDLAVSGDRRAVERLLARLMATLVSASGPGERIGVRTAMDADNMVAIAIDRPVALSDYPGDSVLGIDDEAGDTTLLGTGFALRLARNLARELGGSLVIAPESLTLRLPASVNHQVGQAHLN
jgi:signal transduction histidine kinase